MAPGSRVGSPSSPKLQTVADETLALLVQQFFDDWHYKLMNSSTSRKWQSNRVRAALLDVLALNGVPFEACEVHSLASLDEHSLVWEVVTRMPHSIRNSFENVAQQLLAMLDDTIRVRSSVETRQEDQIQSVMEENDATTVGIQVLKQAVVQATKEVAQLHKCQTTWIQSMEKRLDRMMNAADIAERTQSKLLAVEASLGSFGDEARAKAKKVLMSFAEGQKSTLIHSTFTAWVGETIRNQAQRELRAQLQQEAEAAEQELFDYQVQKIRTIRNVLVRQAEDADHLTVRNLFRDWRDEVQWRKKDGDSQQALEVLQNRLKNFTEEQAETTRKVMARWVSDKDSGLLSLVLAAWGKYCTDSKKDKELEDAVRKAEKQLQDFMLKKQEDAKKILAVLSGSTATGVLRTSFDAWLQVAIEGCKARDMQKSMKEASTKLKTIQSTLAGTVMGVQTRINEQANSNLLFRCLMAWQIEAKVNRVDKYYTAKMESKRKQLQSVQTLFKSFARQLEEGLSNLDGDSSGRSQSRRMPPKGLTRDFGSVSLPDIHARPPVAVGVA